MRNYKALIDNGDNSVVVDFTSNHRANSKANKLDCKCQLYRKCGNWYARQFRVVETWLDK